MRQLLLISIFFVAGSMVLAGSLYVDDNGPDDPQAGNPAVSDPAEDGSTAHPFDAIQEAIDAAVNSDEVIILPGTYTGDGNRDIDFKGKPITIKSENGPDTCVIDCQGTAEEPHRGFVFLSEEGPDSILDGLTIINGVAPNVAQSNYPSGGAIVGSHISSTPTIKNCILSNNFARDGGGICGCSGLIDNCVISSNEAEGAGGGLVFCDGTIVNCTISHNTAGRGGGGLASCGDATSGNGAVISNCLISSNVAVWGGGLMSCRGRIENCQIIDNLAFADGGGLDGVNTSMGVFGNGGGQGGIDSSFQDYHIVACVIQNNTAGRDGGGMSWCEGLIRGCVISGNRTGRNGGGLYNRHTTELNLTNSVIAGNVSGCYGGGIFSEWIAASSLYYTNCTIANNRAVLAGGGITSISAPLEFDGCIVNGNSAPEGPQISVHYPEFADPFPLSLVHCSVEGGLANVYFDSDEARPFLVWGEGNIDVTPLFAAPGFFDPNGTPDDPADDFWVDGDYHLRSQAGRWDAQLKDWATDEVTSPCIDAGNLDSAIGLEPFPNGGVINMGAYGGTAEASKSYFGAEPCETILAGDINGDCMVTVADLAILSRHWLKDAR